MIKVVLLLFALMVHNIAAQTYPPCSTPDGSPGICRPFKTCSTIIRMIESFNGSVSDIPPEVRLFIKNSQCIPNQSWICCARPPVIPKATTTRPTTTTPAPILDLPTAPECGVDTDIRRRILNGEVTRIDEYPWLVLLVKVYTDDPKQSNYTDCGGALINHRYVVTAAHCVKEPFPFVKLHSVRLGEWDTATNPDVDNTFKNFTFRNDPFVEVIVEEIIIHENHDGTTKHNDIALLRLTRYVNYTQYIKPICLPLEDSLINQDLTGDSLDVAGWGKTIDAEFSEKKMKVNINAYSNDECAKVYKPRKRVIIDRQLCAGGAPDIDSCNGDSGGPLVKYYIKGDEYIPYYYLAGIVSFGPRDCGSPDIPGVYTRLSKYVDWIKSKIRD